MELTTRIILDLICEDRALFHDLWMTGSVLGLCCIQYPPNAGFPDLRLVCRLWAAILQALQPQRWRDVYLIPKFTEPSWTSTLDARMPHHFTPMESVMQAFQRSGDLPLQIFVNLSCSDDEPWAPPSQFASSAALSSLSTSSANSQRMSSRGGSTSAAFPDSFLSPVNMASRARTSIVRRAGGSQRAPAQSTRRSGASQPRLQPGPPANITYEVLYVPAHVSPLCGR